MSKTIATAQDDAGTLYVSLRRRTLPDNGLQPLPIARSQPKWRRRGNGHDGTSMFSLLPFLFHLSVIGTASPERQNSRTIYETRY